MFSDKGFTRTIVELIEGCRKSSNVSLYPFLVEHAIRNKILLQLLRTLDINDSLREKQEKNYATIIEEVERISHALKGLSYAFFKLTKPISYVPADIDVLVGHEHVHEATKRLMSLGYKVVSKGSYCITLEKSSTIVDLYQHPTIGDIAYMDGQALLQHSKPTEFNDIEINSLEEYAEALVSASHAFYKELIYTLNDFFTIKKWATKKSHDLAELLNCKPALNFALRLNSMIEKGLLETPYKLSLPIWLALMLHKLYSDSLTRATSPRILHVLSNPRGRGLILSKITRTQY